MAMGQSACCRLNSVILAAALILLQASSVTVVGPQQIAGVREPQTFVGEHGIHVVYGTKDTIYCSTSDDGGKSFARPVKVADAQNLMIGSRRGPRVTVSSRNVVVTAIVDGNVKCWISPSNGKWFSDSPAQINDMPGSAAEGLHAAAAGENEIACAWLDNRDGGQEVYSSVSQDGGENWGPNVLVYKSPGGSVCECCSPSVAIASGGAIYVMFRNSLSGNRDMYVTSSSDDGQTWSTAKQMDGGHWKLDMCPMDGGALDADDQAQVFAIWRRGENVYRAKIGRPETKVAAGVQPWIYAGQTVYGAYLKQRPGPLMVFEGSAPPHAISHDADDPMIAGPASGEGPIVVVWTTSKGEILCQRIDD